MMGFCLSVTGLFVGAIANISNTEMHFRQWFNFHEEFFFLFLLPPIILYPQKTEGEHFVVLLLACSYMSLWFCFSFSHCQDKDDSDDSLTTQAFTESGFSLHPVCLSSQDDVAVFFVSHFSSGFVLLQKISIEQYFLS
jgi:hypothetical protein